MTIDLNLKDSNVENLGRKESRLRQKEKLPKGNRKKNVLKVVIISTIFLLVLGVGYLFYKGYIFSKDLGFKLTPNSLISGEKNTLKKDPSGRFTNVLLIGLDTRENSGLLNTDTIILASYDHHKHNVNLISVPRDFHVEVSEDVKWYTRINSIYSNAEAKKKDSGITELSRTMQRLTGLEIQYYAMVDFNAFVEIIDSVGGVEINVENSFTDYMYPLGMGYQTVSFKAGPQTMDGETALIYSRSRHSMHNNEGTDFARARRQQKVIIAIKEKLLSSETFSNPRTLMNILSSIAGNIRISEFTLNDIDAALTLAKEYEKNNGKTFSFVLDPTIGNYSLVETKTMESGAYAIGPKLGLGKYQEIKEFLSLAINNPELYSEEARVMVYDIGLGFTASREMTNTLKEQLPYVNIVFAGTLFSNREGNIIYSRDSGFETTMKEIQKVVDFDSTEKPDFITTNLNGEDVTILLGKNIDLNED